MSKAKPEEPTLQPENVVIEISPNPNKNPTTKNPKTSANSLELADYLDPELSYFKQYDLETYQFLTNFHQSNPKMLSNIINNEVAKIQDKIIQFFHQQNISNLNNPVNRYKLKRILKQYPIPGISHKIDDPYRDLKLILIIEKFYQTTSRHNDADLDLDSISLSEILDEISDIKSSCQGCPEKKDKCPTFPPNFQKPVFNPCEYPHVLKLYTHFYEHCYDYRNLHGLAGAYYNNMSKKITAPTLVLSAFSSIASFVASSEIIQSQWKVVLTLSVGIMTTLTAMIQAFSSAYQFDLKSSSHFKASDNYDQLITEIDFEKSYPSDTDFFQNLEKKVLEVKSNCQFIIPNYIKSQYYRSKEKANERDFINKNVIKPMETDLREAIVGGDMKNYRFSEQGEHIRQELIKLRNLKTLFLEEEELRKKCCHGSQSNLPHEYQLGGQGDNNIKKRGCCCLASSCRCHSLDDKMIKRNSINY